LKFRLPQFCNHTIMSTSQEKQERDRKKRRAEGVPASNNSNDVDNQDLVTAAARKSLPEPRSLS